MRHFDRAAADHASHAGATKPLRVVDPPCRDERIARCFDIAGSSAFGVHVAQSSSRLVQSWPHWSPAFERANEVGMPTNFAALGEAIATAEQDTTAEFVVSVTPRATAGHPGAALLGLIAAQVALAVIVFADVEFDPMHAGPMVLAASGLAIAAGLRGLPVRWVTTAAERRRAIDNAALAAFTRAGVYRTSRRVGVLVFIALAEREARVLFDQGIIDGVPRDVRDQLRASLHAPVAARDAGAIATAIASWGARLAPYLPRGADDDNELANAPLAADADAAALDRAP